MAKPKTIREYPTDREGYTAFDTVVKDYLKMSPTEAANYIESSPFLGRGLRFKGSGELGLQIHRDDAMEFIRRVREYRAEGII